MFTMFRQYEEALAKNIGGNKKLHKVKYFGCKPTPFFVQNFQGLLESTTA